MKFLLDAQLPLKLAEVMRREGYDVVHATQLSLDNAEDHAIWAFAKENAYVVVSKD